MKGFQCSKSLYLSIHNPELAVDHSSDQTKEMGTSVGELARKLFPKGILIESKDNETALIETEAKVGPNKVLFEGAFKFESFLCRVDILELDSKKEIILSEVKSSTHKIGDRLKPHQLEDVLVQATILSELGFNIKRVNLTLLNKEYTIKDRPEALFISVDVTDDFLKRKVEILTRIRSLALMVTASSAPKMDLGVHCNSPIDCPFKKHCQVQKKLPEVSVLDMQHFNKKYDLVNNGVVEIKDLDKEKMTEGQQEQIRKLLLDKPEVQVKEIAKMFKSWNKQPLYFLDFEAFSNPVPLYTKAHPFSKMPYQFSCYSLKRDKLKKEVSFLAESLDKDPRIACAKALVDAIKGKGSVVVYSQGFEKTVINDLIEVNPKIKAELTSINERIVDLLEVVKKYVYYPAFKNKFSIKVVVPALFGEDSSYSNLAISNGLESVEAYLTAIENKNILEKKAELIEYCDKDVLEMVKIYQLLLTKVNK